MANFITNGGCYNAMRWANDGAGQGSRDWAAGADTDVVDHPKTFPLILATAWDSDDMDPINGDFEVQFRNLTDLGSWTVMTGATEIAWATGTDLVNGNAVVTGERLGQENCSSMGVVHLDGTEREGANAIDLTSITDGSVFDNQWAIDFSGGTDNKEYEFRIVETSTSNVYATLAGTITIVPVGDIIGVTKDNDGSALGSCFVAAFEKVEGGGPPHDYIFRGKTTSDGSGNYTISDLIVGREHFIYAIKEDTPHIFDATDDVLAPV